MREYKINHWKELPKWAKPPYIKRCSLCEHYKNGFEFGAGNARICTIKNAVRFAFDEICDDYKGAEQCQPKDDPSHPFADDVLMGGD